MIDDNIDNYIVIRDKLFRIHKKCEESFTSARLTDWNKSELLNDFGKDSYEKVKVVKDPLSLSIEMKDMYILFLERKILKWDKFI